MRNLTAPFRLLASLVPAALAAQSGGFSTGPVGPGIPATNPLVALAPLITTTLPSPVAGTDVRANQVLTGMQNETSIAVNPLNARNQVGTANDYRFGNVHTGWYTTLDGGQTWTTGTFGVDSTFGFSGDPAVTFDSQGVVTIGCMMYSGPGGVNRVKSYRSLDGGITWQPGVVIGTAAGYDKPQIEADLGPTSPNRDHLLLAWDTFGAPTGDNIVVAVSSNQGVSWSAPQIICPGPAAISPDVAWGKNGEAYVLWADRQLYDVLFDRSFDNGVTWGPDIKIADFTAVPSQLPGNGFRVFDIFAIHADQSAGPFGGRVYVAWHTWTSPALADVVVASSSNQGGAWTAPVKVSSDGAQANDQLFPGVVVDGQGGVNVVYYDQRNDPADVQIWTWISRSSDGGATWRDHGISDLGWVNAGTENSFFIGDYLDLDADRQGLLHPLWCDGRSGSQDVYTDSVNLQLYTNVSTLSAAGGGSATFDIRVGPNHAGQNYVLLATGSGTSPGIPLGPGLLLPINWDVWTDLSLQFAGSAVLPNSTGTLNGEGAAQAQLVLPPFPAFLAGTNLHFTAVTLGSLLITHATPPTRVSLLP
ncbi:MAG: sialidase family protein [Planctomycetota bacterium]